MNSLLIFLQIFSYTFFLNYLKFKLTPGISKGGVVSRKLTEGGDIKFIIHYEE